MSVTGLHFNDIALFAQVIDGLDEQKLNAAIGALREALHFERVTLDFLLFFGVGHLIILSYIVSLVVN